jgi:hypothetical protein|tara:strand:- start:758 stop:1207 length:450 start_codon:yes stop_codon:yes gene_type:complete
MLSLLGSVLGFGTSFLPKVMDFFQDKQDKKHELAIMEVQIRQQKEVAVQQLEMVNVEADIREIEAIQKSVKNTDVKWIDGLRGSVRPVITYCFFGLFIFVEISAYVSLTASGISSLQAVQLVWDDEIMALFAAVLSFWFGGRAINRSRK